MSSLAIQLAWMAPAAIPYRTDAPVSTGTFAFALLITLCLMGLLIAALIFVRRRGWIGWSNAARTAVPSDGIQVQASHRLSIGTTVHAVSYQGRSYLVVESSRGTSATVTPIESPQASDEGTS